MMKQKIKKSLILFIISISVAGYVYAQGAQTEYAPAANKEVYKVLSINENK